MHSINIALQQEKLTLTGELTRETVSRKFEKKSLSLMTNLVKVIDLASVTRTDTAGLAWLLLMLEQANKQAIDIKIVNLPEELTKLAKLSAVDSFLPVQ